MPYINKNDQKEYRKKYYESHRDALLEHAKKRRAQLPKKPKQLKLNLRFSSKTEEERKRYKAQWQKEHRDKRNASARAWANRNKEKHKEANKRWNEKNHEHFLAVKAKWRNENRARYKVYKQARRTLGANAGSFSVQEWESLCAKYGNICLCCKEIKPLTPDHIVPLSKGGKGTIDNIQPLCLTCNKKKHTSTMDYR